MGAASSRAATVLDKQIIRPEQPLLLQEKFSRCFPRDQLEADFVARAKLPKAAEVGRDYVGDFGVAAGGLLFDERLDSSETRYMPW